MTEGVAACGDLISDFSTAVLSASHAANVLVPVVFATTNVDLNSTPTNARKRTAYGVAEVEKVCGASQEHRFKDIIRLAVSFHILTTESHVLKSGSQGSSTLPVCRLLQICRHNPRGFMGDKVGHTRRRSRYRHTSLNFDIH